MMERGIVYMQEDVSEESRAVSRNDTYSSKDVT